MDLVEPMRVDDLAAWSCDAETVLQTLSVDADHGLDANEVLRRQRIWGRNQLEAIRRRHGLSILLAQFKSIVVILLLVAGSLAFLFSNFAEGLAIYAVILINAMIGFLTEWRAIRSMEALRQFVRVECILLRNGKAAKVAASELVPGDIVLFEAGDLVPADMRLFAAAKLTADESTLTGESLPVRKHTAALGKDTAILDRQNMLFKGTSITRGSGKSVVVATGKNTEFGKIFEHVASAKPQQTPLENRLNALGARLAWAIIGIAVLIGVAGILAGRELVLAIEVAIALSVAAIPEGLAIVATIALARGMWRMGKRKALITRLSAVETLGATSVILTDKTGTLTENRMAVSTVLLAGFDVGIDGAEGPAAGTFSISGKDLGERDAALLDELLEVASLCSNASLYLTDEGETVGVGDPTELALLVAASTRGVWRHELLKHAPEIHEDPFDPESKCMATLHRGAGRIQVAVKGAPEAVIPRCVANRSGDGDVLLEESDRERWLARAGHLGEEGLRTIAIAKKISDDEKTDPYDQLILLGIVGLEDPARKGVDRAIRSCHEAGISVVMVTGDHAATARNIATATGVVNASAQSESFLGGTQVDQLFADHDDDALLTASVFSRVTPEQKLQLIDLYQRKGHVVAMTGDGVNDAPALKKADIGVAMGLRGTAVAKQAAAMVLQDDEFNTIVAAVAHGRAIFANIRKFVVYLLSCNSSEVLVVSLATIAGAPLPLLPLQILFLNLVTDVFPALALGVGKGSPSLMRSRPRPANERILTRTHWIVIGLHGLVIAVTVLAAMATAVFCLEFDQRHAVTVSFCTLAFAQMWHVFNMRDEIGRVFDNEITRNSWIWVALLTCVALVLAAVYLPVLKDVLRLADPGVAGWALIIPASLVPVLVAPLVSELVKIIRNRQVT
ncbi:MAG: cation-transporting P-type ATPase [Gammaproteobacteria bacterium]|nr:cation-transporting P-type ATPase [Gammaproteobacteria bacterium]